MIQASTVGVLSLAAFMSGNVTAGAIIGLFAVFLFSIRYTEDRYDELKREIRELKGERC